jgi:Zn-dependent protease with chaperone function
MRAALLAALLFVSGCHDSFVLVPRPEPASRPQVNAEGRRSAPEVAEFFVSVVERVEPVAEAICRERAAAANCDIQIVVDDRPGQPPNAFQTVDRSGRPIVGFTLALIADARNADEIAFVMGHEAAHHILNHIPKRAESAAGAAMIAGAFARANGASPDDIRRAEAFGAEVGARSYSKEFELEADAAGAEIALVAGYDPVRGAAFFSRLPDPGDQFLGSHPPNAERQAQVARVVARLRAGGV